MRSLSILLRLSLRQVASSSGRWVIGAIVCAGTFLLTVGSALISSVDASMSRSVIDSISGHIQVYSERSKDSLALFGQSVDNPELSPVEDFNRVQEALTAIPNVRSVVAMAPGSAQIVTANPLDLALERLRESQRTDATDPASAAEAAARRAHVRHLVALLRDDVERAAALLRFEGDALQDREALNKASSDAFWAGFDEDPQAALEFLDNRIAPHVPESEPLQIPFVATDLPTYRDNFERFQIVEGTQVPAGTPGLLVGTFFYEDRFKLKSARRMDRIQEARKQGRTLAEDAELAALAAENRAQFRSLLLEMDPQQSREVEAALAQHLGSEGALADLMDRFFTLDDANFDARYAFFYEQIAPRVRLYQVRIGDELVLRTVTRTGYVRSVKVKLFGTFTFRGLERSEMIGGLGLMDLESANALFGFATPEQVQENARLLAGHERVDRADGEAHLFGAAPEVLPTEFPDIDALLAADPGTPAPSAPGVGAVVLNAAVLVEDPSLLEATVARIEAVNREKKLGLRVLHWSDATGVVGELVGTAKVVLYVAVFIIFLVALIIISNATTLATLGRVREFGTMRAIGAHRSLVLGMVLVESLLLGLAFGVVGAALGATTVAVLGRLGIPAGSEFLNFVFSGPRLHPAIDGAGLVAALAVVIVVSAASSLLPALRATRVSPLAAMQTDE